MRILAIRGKNLASLEGEFEIDFTAEPLKSAGIFAITGSTGSGKSTLLDALCLALFDDTPRTNRASENNIQITDVKDKTINQKDSRNLLRRGTSDGYAEVDFVSLGGEVFRSRWSVRRSRDRVEGALQSAEFRVTNLTAHIEVQGRKTELLRKVVELIGLTFDQFTRAVLLAQGDFATFLKATQKEKAELLEKLTGTDIYSRISTSIYENSKNAEQELNRIEERMKDIELLSDEHLEALTLEKQVIVQEVEVLKKEILLLTAKIKWIHDEQLLNAGVKQAEQSLADAEKAIAEAKPRCEYLVQVDGVQAIRDPFHGQRNAQQQLTENRATLGVQEKARDANALLLKRSTDQVARCEAKLQKLNEVFATSEPQIRQARELDVQIFGAKTNAVEAEKEHTQALEAKAKIEKTLRVTQGSIETATTTISRINSWFSAHIPYKEIVPRVDLISSLIEDATAALAQRVVNAKICAESKVILDSEIQKQLERTHEAERLNHLLPTEIALLRAKLEEGIPCPVCGSTHHPMSQVKSESLAEEELNHAKKRVADELEILAQRIEKRKSEHIRLESVIESYAHQSQKARNALAGYLSTLSSWEAEFEQGVLQSSLQTIANTWNTHTATLALANERVANLKTSLQHERERLAEAEKTVASQAKKREDGAAELKMLHEKRAQLLGGESADAVEQRLAHQRKELAETLLKLTEEKTHAIRTSEKLSGAITQITQEITKLSERSASLQKVVDDWVFSKNGAITSAQLSEMLSKDTAWLAHEREALNRLHQYKTTAAATLNERKRNLENHYRTEQKPAPEETKDSVQTALADKEVQVQQKATRTTAIDLLVTNHRNGKERIKSFEKELDGKRTLSENWKKLNDMFGSADGAKFKVLAQGYTLDALLIYANLHLQELSKRYELQRISGTLALQVVDLDMLGEVRTVHSLSGGESFLISLALALGLSSLSSNRMKVESLFIDEGFGSLDMDTLRVAMDALERLQTQGRKIGVISHVAEMTERISAQVQVVKTANGRSKIEIIGS